MKDFDIRPETGKEDASEEPPRTWYVLADWSYNAGGTVAFGAATRGYPHNVGAPIAMTEKQALALADFLNDQELVQPQWYASPHGN